MRQRLYAIDAATRPLSRAILSIPLIPCPNIIQIRGPFISRATWNRQFSTNQGERACVDSGVVDSASAAVSDLRTAF